jgi:hypothetical protein
MVQTQQDGCELDVHLGIFTGTGKMKNGWSKQGSRKEALLD